MKAQQQPFTKDTNKNHKSRKFKLIQQAVLREFGEQKNQIHRQKRNYTKPSSSPNMFEDIDIFQLQSIKRQPVDLRPVGLSREVIIVMQQTHKYEKQKISSRLSLQGKNGPAISRANFSYEQINVKQRPLNVQGTDKKLKHQQETTRTNQMFKIHRSKTIKQGKSNKLKSDSTLKPTFHMTQSNSPEKGNRNTKMYTQSYSKKLNLTQYLDKISKQNDQYINRKAVLSQLDYTDQLQKKFGQRYFECILRDNYKEQLLDAKSAFVYQLKDNIKVTPFLRKVYKKRPDLVIRQLMVVKGKKNQGKTITQPIQQVKIIQPIQQVRPIRHQQLI